MKQISREQSEQESFLTIDDALLEVFSLLLKDDPGVELRVGLVHGADDASDHLGGPASGLVPVELRIHLSSEKFSNFAGLVSEKVYSRIAISLYALA